MHIHKDARLTPWRREELALSVIEGRLAQALRRTPMVRGSELACVLVDGVDLPVVAQPGFGARSASSCKRTCLQPVHPRELALADPAMPMERASLAGAHDFILELPEGYDMSTASSPAPGSPASRLRDRVIYDRPERSKKPF